MDLARGDSGVHLRSIMVCMHSIVLTQRIALCPTPTERSKEDEGEEMEFQMIDGQQIGKRGF